MKNNNRLDALVVLSRNWQSKPDRDDTLKTFTPRLSIESKILTRAAVYMFKQGQTQNVIFSGGKTIGQQFPSESSRMKDYMFVLLSADQKNKARERVLVEESSYDTPSNAREVKKIVEEEGFENVGIMAVDVQLPRALGIFSHYNMNYPAFSAEDALRGSFGMDKPLNFNERVFLAYKCSPGLFIERLKEALILRPLQMIDPAGKSLDYIARRIRGQV